MKRLGHIVMIMALTLSWCVVAFAQNPKQLPDVTSTEGREFFVAWLPNGGSDPQSMDLRLQLIASSRKANVIVVEFPNGSTQTYGVAAGQSEIITVDAQTVYWDPARDEEEKPLAKGIRVYSRNDERFTLYSTNQYGTSGTYSFDGAHIIPVEALGTEYMVQTAEADAMATEFLVMSTKPGQTNITMNLKVNSRRGNTQQLNVTLDGSKQIYIVRSKAPNPDDPNDFIDLTGSTICADQPIAVWSGNQFAVVPNQDGMNNDHAYDQLLPLNKWGKEFIVPATADSTALNLLRIVAMQDNTTVNIKRGAATTSVALNSGETTFQRIVITDRANHYPATRYVTSDKPIQVYLYSSSAGANTWYDDDGNTRVPSDPSTTLIPPLSFLTDTTIFRTFNAGDGQLAHRVNIWALHSQRNTIRLDGRAITSGWQSVAANSNYDQITLALTDGTHTLTAPKKCFSGYAYGMNDGQAYLYPVGYDFTPKKDSLFLLDNDNQYKVHWSEWKDKAVSTTEGGWYLDKKLLSNGTYLLDSIFVCDSTTLDFPIKTYSAWYKTIWEITGSIQGENYYGPENQLSASVSRPQLHHKFTLLPEEENKEPFEDFEVRGILIRKPIFCDIPEDKWERDTFNTIVRVMRQYNDTTWRAICVGDTVQFFKDTVWKVNPHPADPVAGRDFVLQVSVFNDTLNNPSLGYHQYSLGSTTVTKHYISSGGCDSLSTLKLFVCSPSFEHKDTVVCQVGTARLDYGDFFKRFKNGNKWPIADTVLYDTLRAKGCMNTQEYQEFRKHCRTFNGCDSVLELHLVVKKQTNNTYIVNQCMSQGTTYEWREKVSNRLIRSFNSDTMKLDSTYIISNIVKYADCEGCPTNGCDSVRNILRLTFVSDGGQTHTVHVCQGESYTYTNMNFQTTFNSNGKRCNTPYVVQGTVNVYGQDEQGHTIVMCSFVDEVTFWVDTVYKDQMTYDTICWDPTATNQKYNWINHPNVDIPITHDGLITKRETIPTFDTGCDSICVLKLTVGRPYLDAQTWPLCDNDTLRWQDTLFVGARFTGTLPAGVPTRRVTTSLDTRRDTVSRYGCDSIFTLHIDLYPTGNVIPKDTSICENEVYTFYGQTYTWAARPEPYVLTYKDYTSHHCDSSVQHNVYVYPAFLNEREPNDTVCQVLNGNFSYVWEGVDHQDWNNTQNQYLKRPKSYELVDNLETIHGCDSIIHRTLVVLPSYDDTISHTMSNEDSFSWIVNYDDHTEKRIYAGMLANVTPPDDTWQVIRCSGDMMVTDSLTTHPIGTHFCDSVRTLNLRIGKVFRDTVYDATCANCGTYNWVLTSPIDGHDTIIYIQDIPAAGEVGTYYNRLTTSLGYDSIYVLKLTAYPSWEFQEGDEVCQGQTYVWTDHIPMFYGTVIHQLYYKGQPITDIPTDQNSTIQIVDSMRTQTVYFHNPKTGEDKPIRCDSVWTLTLTIRPTYSEQYVHQMDHKSMASNDTVSHFTQPRTLFVGYDFDYDAAGTSKAELEAQYPRVVYIDRSEGTSHYDSVRNTSQYGCDSLRYVQINICEVKFTLLHDSIADNDTTWYFGGETAHREHTLPLITGHQFHKYDDGTPVDYSVADGRTVREYLFVDTLRSANGCDSIVHDSLRVFPTYRFDFDTAVCSNTRYDWRVLTKLNEQRTGTYYDSVNYTVGTHEFDSVYVLNLDVMPSGYWQYDTVLCMNDTIWWHYKQVYYRPGGLTYVEADYKDGSSPCGEKHHLDLTFMPFYGATLVEYDTICQHDPYPWISPGEVKEHKEALRDEAGNPIDFIPTDVAGEFTYYDSLKTKSCGCDSIYTLHLVIKPAYHIYTDTAICTNTQFTWVVTDPNGNTHTTDKIYESSESTHFYDTIGGSTSGGCDSTYYLHVFVDQPYEIHIDTTICYEDGHFEWTGDNGLVNYDDLIADSHNWFEPRLFEDELHTVTARGKCDSTMYLHLTIAPSADSTWTDTICIGETYTLFEERYTQAGEYDLRHENYWGCMVNYHLNLHAIPATTIEVLPEPVCINEAGQDFTYTLRYSYAGEFQPITYTVHYDSIAGEAGFEDQIDMVMETNLRPGNEYELYLPTPRIDIKENYPRPDHYHATIAFQNGVCLSDSLMTYPLQITMSYPNWLMEQRHGDVIALLKDTYNGGYTWSEYQWYEDTVKLIGQTRPYLHIPTGLKVGAWYHVELTREGEEEAFPTCEIQAVANPINNDFEPTMGYLSVTPTCVVTGHPNIYILSRHDGTYRVTTTNGHLVTEGVFRADVTELELPAVTGMYIVQLWSADTPEEPYRAIKVFVREQCPNCDISSF